MAPICSIKDCERSAIGRQSLCRKHYQRKYRHGDPLYAKIGERGEGFLHCGYKAFRVNGKIRFEHVQIAEKALGRPLPEGAHIHHMDENPLNNDPHNLVICPDAAYHKLLHLRARAWRAIGDPTGRKCVYCGKYDHLGNVAIHKSGRNSSRAVHLACAKAYNQAGIARRNGTH